MNTAKRMYELVASEYNELTNAGKEREEEKKETLGVPPREKQRSAARLAFEEKKMSFKTGAIALDLAAVGNGVKARTGSRERGSSRKLGKKKRGASAVPGKRGKKKA